MFCSACGEKIDDGGKFCASCGSSVSQVESQNDNENNIQQKKVNIKKVDFFFLRHPKYFTPEQTFYVRENLSNMTDDNFSRLMLAQNLKKPINNFWISFFFGSLGIDRFRIKNIGFGVAKLCLGFLASIFFYLSTNEVLEVLGFFMLLVLVVDLFLIMNATRNYNYNEISDLIWNFK